MSSIFSRFSPYLRRVPGLIFVFRLIQPLILKAVRGPLNELRARVADLSRQLEISQREVSRLEQLLVHYPAGRAPSANGPLVSIALPTFNRACVTDAIDSVLRQTYQNWELLVVDDGSTDQTHKIVEPYLRDSRIKFFRRPHQGPFSSRNFALDSSSGSLIAYLDSDCIWYPNFLATMVAEFEKDATLDFAYGALVFEEVSPVFGRVLFEAFDRSRLLEENFIDTNVIVHRKALVDRYGGFDTELPRLGDWDLALRFTVHAPAKMVPVPGTLYRIRDANRVSEVDLLWPSHFRVAKKWYPAASPNLTVLYVVWHYPQLSETYIEAEIQCMQRWGVHVEVWCEVAAVSPYAASVPVHRGTLEDAIESVRPDIIHVHWLGFALAREQQLRDLGIPVSVRLHGFEVTSEALNGLLQHSWVRHIYAFPHQLKLTNVAEARIRPVNSVFDTTMFKPCRDKDRKLVVRTAAALASKDLPFFFELAARLPDHRFVLAAVTCNDREEYVSYLHDLHKAMNSNVELIFDVPRDQVAELMARAGIYFHTARKTGMSDATPIGMPISIAEAMATGAFVVTRDIPELQGYVGDVGSSYRDLDDAVELIRQTMQWSDQDWHAAWTRSIERAYQYHADELVLRPVLEDWTSLAAVQPANPPRPQ